MEEGALQKEEGGLQVEEGALLLEERALLLEKGALQVWSRRLSGFPGLFHQRETHLQIFMVN